MASASYIRQRRERASARGKLGNEVKRRRMQERGADLQVVGGCTTWGNLGAHTIELLACDDPTHVWIRVDGQLRTPRTMRGFKRVMGDWLFR